MEYACNMHGIHMEHTWNTHVKFMEYVCTMDGIRMHMLWCKTCLAESHAEPGSFQGPKWTWPRHRHDIHGQCNGKCWAGSYPERDNVWNMYGTCIEYTRYMPGICMQYAQDVFNLHEICMEYAWSMYGTHAQCLTFSRPQMSAAKPDRWLASPQQASS